MNKKSGFAKAFSDPIYGFKFGFYYLKIKIAKDKFGKEVLDSLTQSIELYGDRRSGRDYAIQYKIKNDEKSDKILAIYPHNRKNLPIKGYVPKNFKIGHINLDPNMLSIEYVPIGESVHHWSKMMTLLESKPIHYVNNRPFVFASLLSKVFYDKFHKSDKNLKISYKVKTKDGFVEIMDKNPPKMSNYSSEIVMTIDYADFERTKKRPNEREFLVVKFIKSNKSVWQIQFTARYNKKWSKKKIKALKDEVSKVVDGFEYVNKISLDQDDIIERQRLDDVDFHKKYYQYK